MKKPSGLFDSPYKGERVGRYVTVSGSVQNIPFEKYLWVAHRRVKGGLIWPKEPNIVPDDNGEFSITTFEGGSPGNLVISLLLVDESASNDFRSWLEKGHKTGDYPGMKVDGESVIELASVDVTYDNTSPVRVFISYSHEDEALRRALDKHLALLKRIRLIEIWHDRRIVPGTDVDDKIHSELDRADLILILVSSSFLASDYCYGKEMRRAFDRHQAGKARVVPVIVRAVDWEGAPFRHLLALPTDGNPVKSWSNEDEAWVDVAKGIRKVIEDLR